MKKAAIFLTVFLMLFLLSSPVFAFGGAENPSMQDSSVGNDFDDIGDFEDDPFSDEEAEVRIADPIESFNRVSFWFNDKLYFYLLKPVARGYRVVPEKARTSVSNFFSNLATPIRFANSLLQLKFGDAGRELGRFALNTTVGIAGLLDPAKSLGMSKKEEDFGQTLGYYGAGPGFYLVIPVLGPSSLRDGVGLVGDHFLDPLTYYLSTAERIGAKTYKTVNFLSLDKDSYESMKEESLDPYLFIRNAYTQRREALVRK